LRKFTVSKFILLIIFIVSILSFSACSNKGTSVSSNSEKVIVYGKVTAISGKKVTVAIGTLKQPVGNQNSKSSSVGNATNNTGNSNNGSSSNSSKPIQVNGNTSQNNSANGSNVPQGNLPGGNNVNLPNGGTNGAPPDLLTLTGKSKTFEITDTSIITKEAMQLQNSSTTSNSISDKNAASLSDISIGTILKITYYTDSNKLISVQIIGGGPNQPGNAGDTAEVTGTGLYTLKSGDAIKSNETLETSKNDQSAVIVSNGASLTLKNMSILTSGNTSSMDSSSFYGLNAAVLAQTGSKISILNSKINTTGTGANGVFACGSGASIELSNVDIQCKASGAHGVDATKEGKITMKNVNITTAGNGASAAIATDRGGGTISATGGIVITTGTKSPAIYSTGKITVNNATLKSSSSEVAVIEGKNSIIVNNCNMTSEKNYGVFIYQSMSGDAEVGSGMFTMNGGSLTVKEGPIFYSTNTVGVINLKNAIINGNSGVLLKAGADQWGNKGENGSQITLIADTQKLTGDVILDDISTAILKLKNNSELRGAINTGKTAKFISLSLDKSSTWYVTKDSYLTSITDEKSDLTNIISNGHTIYYKKSNSANSWLGGKTINLCDGGKLVPID
jgi:hypothetical protein